MSIALPEPISAFFHAKNAHDADATLTCFVPTAIVFDEGEKKELTGHQAIKEWLEGTIAAYKLTTEATSCSDKDGETLVTALVSGDFPGSPIEFEYHFQLTGDKIDRLAIK